MMLKYFFATLACCSLYLISPGQPWAGSFTRECKDVSNLASIDYDDSLILSVFSDGNAKTCRFAVSLPPNISASAPSNTFEKAFDALTVLGSIRAKNDQGSAGWYSSLQENFAPALEDALITPLNTRYSDEPGSKTLADIISGPESQKVIQLCSTEILTKRAGFDSIGGAISCGRIGERTFGIQARYENTSFGVLLPAF
ncbi:hypothetical protein G6L29_10615 [Agrobacterium rhizogenes]|uniref:hypothetical protein n=1 Tax=Rhizobium rhizogenes TaxID=359 RepID=UPI00157412B5|nr:hypothetical protein [Rhizobium rhizogenes]NTI16088.1 hypothetical protein [Rhizobium rhizogenes]